MASSDPGLKPRSWSACSAAAYLVPRQFRLSCGQASTQSNETRTSPQVRRALLHGETCACCPTLPYKCIRSHEYQQDLLHVSSSQEPIYTLSDTRTHTHTHTRTQQHHTTHTPGIFLPVEGVGSSSGTSRAGRDAFVWERPGLASVQIFFYFFIFFLVCQQNKKIIRTCNNPHICLSLAVALLIHNKQQHST